MHEMSPTYIMDGCDGNVSRRSLLLMRVTEIKIISVKIIFEDFPKLHLLVMLIFIFSA